MESFGQFLWSCGLVYRIVAARGNETVRWERTSELIAVAKARVWTSEDWHVAKHWRWRLCSRTRSHTPSILAQDRDQKLCGVFTQSIFAVIEPGFRYP